MTERVVGYALDSDLGPQSDGGLGLGQKTTFGGETVAGSDILIRYVDLRIRLESRGRHERYSGRRGRERNEIRR